jgi:hypothetical protein
MQVFSLLSGNLPFVSTPNLFLACGSGQTTMPLHHLRKEDEAPNQNLLVPSAQTPSDQNEQPLEEYPNRHLRGKSQKQA